MTTRQLIRRARAGTALAALAIAAPVALAPALPATAQPSGNYKPSRQLQLSVGEGEMVNLPRSVASVWTSNPKVADVHVNTPRQINVFGGAEGEATVIATAADGSVVYGASVRVSPNLGSVNEALRAAMPESDIRVTTIGQTAIINGTVASPDDAAQAEMLVKAILNAGIKEGEPLRVLPVNRLRTAVPLQVTLRVKIAEVNRDLLKQIGVNLLATDPTSGFQFGIAQGGGIALPVPGEEPFAPTVIRNAIGSTLTGAGNLFGVDVLGSLDLAETDGMVVTLAEPNLTALSGETASFLAGGEFPIPVSQALGSVAIEYKQYGVSLAFTPIVLGDGRISMRVRPEVSELAEAGSIRLNGFDIPALTTRRAETTVELGSGQSFMLAGLLKNGTTGTLNKAPFLGDLPILGALFRSTKYRRQESELVIIVTPYLVRPVSQQMAMPTDGYRLPTDAQAIGLGQTFTGQSGRAAVPAVPAPAVGGGAAAAAAPGFKL